MGAKHRASQSLAALVAVVAVAGLALVLGFVMGNYAITAVVTRRPGAPTVPPAHRTEPPGPGADQASQRATLPPQPGGDGDGGRAETSAGTPALFRVQVGPLGTREEAAAVSDRLRQDGYPTYVLPGPPYRVQVGAFASQEAAERLAAELRAKRYANAMVALP